MAFEPYLQNIQRYSRTFNPITPNAFVSPFYFMAAATTGVCGDVVSYSTEDTITIATSGALRHQIAGFLMQDVKDLDAGPVKGYRNYNNTVEHLGGNVGVLQSNGVAETKRYAGSPAVGARLCVAVGGHLRTYGSSTLETGDPLAVVEATVGSATPTIEPQQFSTAGGPDWIRIRIYNL